MRRLSHLDQYDIINLLNLRDKIIELEENDLPFSCRGFVFSKDVDQGLLIDGVRQGYSLKNSSLTQTLKFIIDYITIAETSFEMK